MIHHNRCLEALGEIIQRHGIKYIHGIEGGRIWPCVHLLTDVCKKSHGWCGKCKSYGERLRVECFIIHGGRKNRWNHFCCLYFVIASPRLFEFVWALQSVPLSLGQGMWVNSRYRCTSEHIEMEHRCFCWIKRPNHSKNIASLWFPLV